MIIHMCAREGKLWQKLFLIIDSEFVVKASVLATLDTKLLGAEGFVWLHSVFKNVDFFFETVGT